MSLYPGLVRPLLFRADPERAHDLAVRAGELASGSRLVCRAVASRRAVADPRLAVEIVGLRFATPLGLAAGFDKSARAVPLLSALGFGHVEIGSVSADPSDGNPRPRLFRLADSRAIVVHYGVPNDGAERVAERLSAPRPDVPLGINVVSTNRGAASAAEPDDAVIGDYVASVSRLQALGDYVCLNLSCPNTRDGVGFFADRARLRALLDRLGDAGVSRPLFIKVAPFASRADLDSFLAAVDGAVFVSGFSVNLPPGKPPGCSGAAASMPGAVSGPPCAPAALRTVSDLYRAMDRKRFVVIGSGGIASGADAYAMIRRGASLVQLYTALVYEGPSVVRRVTSELSALVARDGLARVSDAVGADV
jgi:dihydroorotate dehydrogenase (fumarate)/dihydroorotate dehydrogenase